jgi:catechol 2,3-dioxygenase-like lactoylglutathione lyase family enzyme
MPQPTFQSAAPYHNDVLALPVTDLDAASAWYTKHFGMCEVDRTDAPVPTVILERNGTRIGFAMAATHHSKKVKDTDLEPGDWVDGVVWQNMRTDLCRQVRC